MKQSKRQRQARARRLGMQTTKRARSAGRPAGCTALGWLVAAVAGSGLPFAYAQVPPNVGLPNQCVAGQCGGRAFDPLRAISSVTTTPNTMRLVQQNGTAILNWRDFNIAQGNTVQFLQPDANSVALNRIYDARLTSIDGKLIANGQIYLINPNGILFGSNARVDVAGLIASTLDMSDERITRGLLTGLRAGEPVAFGNAASGKITVETGAVLYAAGRDQAGTVISAGRVFLFAPEINNAGTVKVDGGGQVIFAGGRSVYLGTSTDPTLRGLLVEVKDGGSVDNSGTIQVARGNVTLMGLAVNQAGSISATSAIRENGTIRLIARETDVTPATAPTPLNTASALYPTSKTGRVTLASGSKTVVTLDSDDKGTAPLNDSFAASARSTITIEGGQVQIGGTGPSNSTLVEARGGDIFVTARTDVTTALYRYNDPDTNTSSLLGRADPAAVVTVGADAKLDVSGLRDVQVDGARNFIFIDRLTSNDLRDAPLQRDGFLRGKGVYLNVGVDHPFIDTSTRRAALAGTQAERNATAGTVALRAEGAVNVAAGATIDVSGGTVNTLAATGRTSQLIAANGTVVDIMRASADVSYIGFADQLTVSAFSPREGINQQQSFSAPRSTFVGGFIDGKSAGTVEIYASGGRIEGTLVGATTYGPQQRSSLPAGGQLRIGSAVAPADLDSQAYLPRANILLGDDLAALQQSVAQGDIDRTLVIDTSMLKRGGFSRLALTSDGRIELAPQSALDLGPRGQFTVQANAVTIGSSITAPGGSITVRERPLSAGLGDVIPIARRDELNLVPETERGAVKLTNVAFSTAGRWTNDFLLPADQTPASPVILNGGNVSVSGRTVDVSQARFDVSAGATLNHARKFSGGAAGTLSIAATGGLSAGENSDLRLGSQLAERVSGFGVTAGGQLSIQGSNSITLGALGPTEPDSVMIDPELAHRGFAGYAFSARESVSVAAGARFVPDVLAIPFSQSLLLAPSAATLSSVASPQSALSFQQRPAQISLSSLTLQTGVTRIQSGAVVDAGVQGRIAITGGSAAYIDGTLNAPAGTVSVALKARESTSLSANEIGRRVLEVGSSGSIDVSGVSLVTENASQQRTGNVLDAGTVSLTADSGYLVVAPGARIAARGARDAVTIPAPGSAPTNVDVASRGGGVRLSADMGLYLQGGIDGHGGAPTAEGGRLSIALNTPSTLGLTDPAAVTLVQAERRLLIDADPPTLPVTGGAFDATLAGKGRISPNAINAAGLDGAWIASGDTIAVDKAASLSTRVVLALDTQNIAGGNGGSLALAAPYVAVGAGVVAEQARFNRNVPVTPASTGTATVNIQATDIDLVGDFALQGIGSARLAATNDVRGVGDSRFSRPTGALRFGGNLSIEAAQLYPVTNTDYKLESNAAVGDLANGRLEITRAAASTPLAPLSAGGSLTLSAPDVVIAGTVAAPLGAIDIVGSRSVTLAPGSEVTVAGQGVVPYGTVSNGTSLTYLGATLASPQELKVPAKEVRISAPTVDLQPGSRVNLSGGGETRATEFVAGPGGSLDVSLNFPDAANTAGRNSLFALVPARGSALAPFDPQTYRNLSLNGASTDANVFRVGQTITIAAGSGIPAGTYSVLPARYALLPGAYAAQPVSGYQDIAPQRAILEANGTVIVAGKLGFAAAGTVASRGSGFRIYNGDQFRKLAEFRDYSGDAFFSAAAKAQGVYTPRLAADAAALSIDGTRVQLASELKAAPAAGGRGAEIALSAPTVIVRDQLATISGPQETLQLNAAQLSALNAETLVLGAAARRSNDGATVALSRTAANVSVDSTAPLTAGEIILTAQQRVSVGPNAILRAQSVDARSPATRTVTSEGDGATLWTSGASAESLTSVRNGASAPGSAARGSLNVGENASISGRSVLFDASRDQSYAPGFKLQTELATLSGATVNFGEIPVATPGLNLTSALLAQFGAAKRLSVASASGFSVYGSADVGVLDTAGRPLLDELRLVGSGFSGQGGTTSIASLNAGRIVLLNSGSSSTPAGTGSGALRINATAGEQTTGNVELGGNFSVSGFSQVSVAARGRSDAGGATVGGTGDLRLTGPVAGSVGLNVGNADLTIDAARITADRGVRASVSTTGNLQVNATSAAVNDRPQELGAALALSARRVDFGGRIDLPAGVVQINALGSVASDDVVLRSGASINVAGLTQQFGPTTADVSAGQIQLASASGSVVQAAGARLDLRGTGDKGDAGTLTLSAANGAVRLQGEVLTSAGAAARGADMKIDAATLGNLSEIATALTTGAGGGSAHSIALRARSGNLDLAAGDTLRAERITLAADGAGGPVDGSVQIAGQLIARGPDGGRVDVYARNQAILKSGAVIDARPPENAGGSRDGGQVMISARVTNDPAAPGGLDAIMVEPGARIDVSPQGSGLPGQITLRSKRTGDDVAVAALPSDALRGGRTIVEGVIVLPTTAGNQTVDVAAQQSALQSYMSSANRAAMSARLGQAGNASFSLRPGLEVQATGNLTVNASIDFAQGLNPATDTGNFLYRYGGSSLASSEPGALTLRAGGNVAINANISDGFASAATTANVFNAGDSWRYGFTAGADLAAANPNQAIAGGSGVLSIGLPTTDTVVRTGTGSISLNAASDVVLNNGLNRQGNVAYTAGVRVADTPLFPTVPARGINPVITRGGGDVTVLAGRDVLGAQGNNGGSNQLVNEWLWRGGLGSASSPAVYWVNFGVFQQGFGALGGGDLSMSAGRDIVRVGAVVAGNGFADGARTVEYNRGALDVAAAGRIQQGLFFNQSGEFDVRAARIEPDVSRPFTQTRLAHGNNAVNVQARESAEVALPFNPTAFAPALRLTPSPTVPDDYKTYFFTYGNQSSASVRVAAGDLAALPLLLPIGSPPGSALARNSISANFRNIAAPSVDLIAFGGAFKSNDLFRLFPAGDSSLRVLAGTDVSGLIATMLQADPARLASLVSPGSYASAGLAFSNPFESSTALHASDVQPSVVVASKGSASGLNLDLAEAAEIHAAQTISNGVTLQIQNANADSVTRITAGKGIDLSQQSTDWIRIYGQGVAEIVSGGPINLGTNAVSGILSRGNLVNANLPAQGASLFVFGGTGTDSRGLAQRPDYVNAVRAFLRSDAFAAAGAQAGVLNAEVLASLRRNPLYAAFVAVLDAGLANRGAVDDPASNVSNMLARLSPSQLAEGALRLAASVQEAANRRFVQSKNTDTFAAGYATFNDLFPALNDSAGAVRSFIRANPFIAAGNSAELRQRALAGLPLEFANAVQIGLSDPSSLDAAESAFARALAAFTPQQLQAYSRALLANTLRVAGAELDSLRSVGRVDSAVGTPFAVGLTDFAAAYSAAGPAGANDISLVYSQIKVEQTGRLAVIDPRGSIVVGQSSPPVGVLEKPPSELGIFTLGGGDVIGMARDNVDVFRSRVFTVAGGDVTLWSSLGNIDAGRGPRDVSVAPAPRLVQDPRTGNLRLDLGGAVSGSGIGALKTRDDQAPSNIALIAPKGFIDAGEAGIRADSGTVTLGTNIVINAGNISASGGVSGGAVAAAPPPLPPSNNLGGNSSERAIEEAKRAAADEQREAEKRAAREKRTRVLGEFLGFGEGEKP